MYKNSFRFIELILNVKEILTEIRNILKTKRLSTEQKRFAETIYRKLNEACIRTY